MPRINASLQHCTKHPGQYIKIRNYIKIWKGKTKLSLSGEGIITYIQNLKEFADIFLERMKI